MQVSLITCTLNSERTIKNCCLCISAQSLKTLEHIIIDNQSKDQTIQIANQYKINNQKIIQQKGNGIYGALNEGLKIAQGEIVGLLHSDDEFIDQEFLKEMVSIFINSNIDVFFSNLFYTKKNDTNKIIRKWISDIPEGLQKNEEIKKKKNNGWMPPHTTIFFKKSLLEKVGYYDENFKISSDYDFIIRLLRIDNINIYFQNKFTLKMRLGGTSNRGIKNIINKMREDYKIMKKNSLNPLTAIFLKNISKIKQFFV